MWKYILGAAVLWIVLYMWRSWRFSSRVFADEHFVEFAEVLFDLKESALSRMEDVYDGEVDYRATSAGLAVSYSIEEADEQFHHHLAISTPDRPTPHAIGDRFVHFAIWILGLPVDRFRLESSETTIHHGKVTISEDEQDRFVQSSRRIPSKVEIQENVKRYVQDPPQCHSIRVGDT